MHVSDGVEHPARSDKVQAIYYSKIAKLVVRNIGGIQVHNKSERNLEQAEELTQVAHLEPVVMREDVVQRVAP